MRSRGLLSLLVVLSLGLSACTKDSSTEQGVISDSVGGVRAEWSSIDAAEAAPEGPLVSVAATVPAQGGRPGLVVGRVTAPGAPSVATVWHVDAVGPDDGVSLEVGEGDAAVHEAVSIGDKVYALGSRWHDGVAHPFLRSSEDGKVWSAVDLPADVVERGISLARLAGEASTGPFVAGLDEEDKPVVVMVQDGDIVTLPTPDYGRVTAISGLAASKKRLAVLVAIERDAGGKEIRPFTSSDVGATWDAHASLSSTEPSINGVASVPGGFVATGYSLRGTNYLAASWFSKNGASWRVETSLPSVPGHASGWSSWASAPTVSGKNVYAALSDAQFLRGTVVRRSPDGRWSTFGELPAWRTPGATAHVVAAGKDVVAIRSWNGLVQTGTFNPQGRWTSVSDFGATPNVSWWETVGQIGEETLMVGAHTEVTTTPDQGWSRKSVLSSFALTDTGLESTEWQHASLAAASGVTAVTDEAGNSLVAAQLPTSADPGGTNSYDVAGWLKAAGDAAWKPVTGLTGPRSEFVTTAAVHGSEWVVVGTDRASFNVSDHSYGALWTSADGASWKRAKGPFDVDRMANSWLSSTCALPDGDLLAVGGVEDSGAGSRPVAFRRTEGTWKPLDLSALGDNVSNLGSCAGTTEVTLLQGSAGGRDVVWSTADAKEFTALDVGDPNDTIGTIKTMDGGFAAPGGIFSGLQDRAVVWLSSDGETWHAVDVPADRDLTATDVVATPAGVVVALTGANGPAVGTLENASELLR